MSDSVKDVEIEQKVKETIAQDNIRLDEIVRGYRVLYFNKDHFLARQFKIDSIRIYDKAILQISKYGDELFTRTKNRLSKDPDMLTYNEQMRILIERGLWDEQKEKELNELRKKSSEAAQNRSKKISQFQNSKNKNDQKEIENLTELYENLFERYSELAAIEYVFLMDTIEIQAQTEQRKGWLVSAITRNEGEDAYDPDKRLWKNVNDLEKTLKRSNIISLIQECVNYWDLESLGGDSFFAESPEELKPVSDGEPQKS